MFVGAATVDDDEGDVTEDELDNEVEDGMEIEDETEDERVKEDEVVEEGVADRVVVVEVEGGGVRPP